MLEVIVSDSAGFCFGVKRAVDMAFTAALSSSMPADRIYSFGPVIHNPQVVTRLHDMGVEVIDSESRLRMLKNGKVLFRSHGIPNPELAEALGSNGVNVLDATCPYVKKAQTYAKRLVDEGYSLVIIGDAKHPEVASILGHCGGTALVTESVQDIMHLKNKKRIGIISQTTQTHEKFVAIVSGIIMWAEEVKILNTICGATRKRQGEATKIAGNVDLMIVIGGKNSANTTKLADVCRKTNKNTVHIETQEEISANWFTQKIKKVGVTGGASTPDWIIEEVIKTLAEVR